MKIDLSLPPTDASAIQAVTPSDVYSWAGPDVPLTQSSERSGIENKWFALTGRVVALKVENSLHTSESEWSDLKLAMSVRNRLMHPKKPEDLTVSEAEVEAASRASAWIDAKHRELQELAIDKIAYDEGMTAEELREFRTFRKRLSKGD